MEENLTLISRFDGRQLACAVFTPDDVPVQGVVQLAHGMCEHKERYFPFMRFLNSHGFAAVISDHRGHGGSAAGNRGHFGRDTQGDAITRDLWQVTELVKSRFPGVPLTLFGHSMGSLVVRKYLQTHDDALSRLIVCGSPSANPLTDVAIALCRVMALFRGENYRSPLVQRLSTGNGSRRFPDEKDDLSWLCSDPEVRARYRADPDCNFTFTLNGYLNLFHLVKHVYTPSRYQVHQPALPILFIAGADDPVIVSPQKWQSAQDFLRRVGYTQVAGKLYPGMRHEILGERGKERVYADVMDFLEG